MLEWVFFGAAFAGESSHEFQLASIRLCCHSVNVRVSINKYQIKEKTIKFYMLFSSSYACMCFRVSGRSHFVIVHKSMEYNKGWFFISLCSLLCICVVFEILLTFSVTTWLFGILSCQRWANSVQVSIFPWILVENILSNFKWKYDQKGRSVSLWKIHYFIKINVNLSVFVSFFYINIIKILAQRQSHDTFQLLHRLQ